MDHTNSADCEVEGGHAVGIGEVPCSMDGREGRRSDDVVTPRIRIRVVFEGGGAKGIGHVGALRAVEESGVEVVGFAGASAGAIVAALAAAGVTARDMFDPEGTDDLLKRHDLTPLRLLGTGRWWLFRFLLAYAIPAFNLVPILAMVLMVLAFVGTSGTVGVALMSFLLASLAVPTTFLVILARRLGFLSTERLAGVVDAELARRLREDRGQGGGGRPFTFAELASAGGRELKVVVSEIEAGELALLDAATPDVSVGRAVAASAAIPLVFEPVDIECNGVTRRFVDGGLVSNLPCWVFADGPRAVDDPAETIVAFRLGKGAGPRRWPFLAWSARMFGLSRLPAAAGRRLDRDTGRSRLRRHLLDVFETGIGGSQRVVERLVPGLVVVDLCSPLSTYDFDADRATLLCGYDSGYLAAKSAMAHLTRGRKVGDDRTRRGADRGNSSVAPSIIDAAGT